MEMTGNDIKQFIQSSFTAARAEPDEGDSVQEINQSRSRNWVKSLANQLRIHYPNEQGVRVFSKYDDSNRKDFGLNELLHDIVVCRVGDVPSAKHKKTLCFVKETIWQVESEFARDSRQALIDFNKLVLGSAYNKLFIGPQVNKTEQFLNVLKPAARACTGNVYVALIPHPSNWKNASGDVKLWSLKQ
jgi:hypothetical protein